MPRGYARYVLGVMVGINFLNYLDRYILPAVASRIQAEFHLSDSEVGLLGSAFLLVYAVGTIPFGIWEPRRGAAEERGPTTRAAGAVTAGTVLNLLRIPTLRATIAAETALFFVLGGAAFWLPTYLSRQYGLGTGAAGTLAGGVLVLGLLAGSLVGGSVADRLTRRRAAASNLPVGIAGFVAGAVLVALALVMPNLILFVPMFLLGSGALYLYKRAVYRDQAKRRPADNPRHGGHHLAADRALARRFLCALCDWPALRRGAQPAARTAHPAAAATAARGVLRQPWLAARGSRWPGDGGPLGRRNRCTLSFRSGSWLDPVKQVVLGQIVGGSHQAEDLAVAL